jgi:thiamine-phosphate pyrophosphorylase
MNNFRLIAITLPNFIDNESNRITALLEAGFEYVHIRKPDASPEQIAKLIGTIDKSFWSKLKLHDHFELLTEFALGGVHINKRNPIAPAMAKSISKSCHTYEELDDAYKFDYVTLSPIFDSISKPGYNSTFNLKEINIEAENVIALGGITADKIPLIKQIGFAGAALSGYLFNSSYDKFTNNLKLITESF